MSEFPDDGADLTAAPAEIGPTVAARSLSEYLVAWWAGVRSGDAGVLPVVVALIAVTVVFTIVSPNHVFLTPGNLVNLFDQSAVFIVLAIGEGFALLLGEIDLSIGYVGAIGGIVAGLLVQAGFDWPWWLAMVAGLAACAAIGATQGSIVSRLHIPSFVVTLAGYLFWFGVMIAILGTAGEVGVNSTILDGQIALHGIVYSYIDPVLAWIGLVVIVAVMGGAMWIRDASRRRSGLVAPPIGVTVARIAAIAVAGIAVVAICNVDRGKFLPIVGVPWVVPLVLIVVGAATVLLERTPFGRHVYAVSATPRQPDGQASTPRARPDARVRVPCSATAGSRGSSSSLAAGRSDHEHQRRPAGAVRGRGRGHQQGGFVWGPGTREIHGLLGQPGGRRDVPTGCTCSGCRSSHI